MGFYWFKITFYWFPRIIGRPFSPEPITITLELLDSDSFKVASIPFSWRILSVNEALKILFALALPSASILCLSASCSALTSLNSYSRASCSCTSFLSIPSLIAVGRVTSLTKTEFSWICWVKTLSLVSSKISFWIASLFVE